MRIAAGLLLQSLPGGDQGHLAMFRTMLDDGLLVQALGDQPKDVEALLHALLPEAELLAETRRELRWQCSCSYERVLGALQMLDLDELKSMLDKAEYPEVKCEFCGTHYVVSPEDLDQAYLQKKSSGGGTKN